MNPKIALTLPSVYIDITEASHKEKYVFIVGEVIVSLPHDIQSKLWEKRAERGFFRELHFHNLREGDDDTLNMTKEFIKIFFDSKSNFRVLVVEDKPITWQGKRIKTTLWKRKAAWIRLLMKRPYFWRDKQLFEFLIRPRVFIDNENLSFEDGNNFKKKISEDFIVPELLNKKDIKLSRSPVPIVDFCDSKLLDQLQLTDILLGCVRVAYEYDHKCPNPAKQSVFEFFMEQLNSKRQVKELITNLRNFKGKEVNGIINIWELNGT